jgi:hypothetical protein
LIAEDAGLDLWQTDLQNHVVHRLYNPHVIQLLRCALHYTLMAIGVIYQINPDINLTRSAFELCPCADVSSSTPFHSQTFSRQSGLLHRCVRAASVMAYSCTLC